jgi:hypothetical protein
MLGGIGFAISKTLHLCALLPVTLDALSVTAIRSIRTTRKRTG